MVQAKKRVSYIIPTPSENVSRLRLPPLGVARLGATGPLLIPYTSGGATREETARPKQPRHRLGISSLALDSSTQLVERIAPEGILYSGGRDGLIMSWDLGIPLRKRNLREWGSGRRPRGKWETLTGWGDDVIEEETDDDDRPTSDGDILGEVTNNLRKRRQAASMIGIPYERQWEVDTSGFEAGTVS
jgi:WD repeat-containing protein 48